LIGVGIDLSERKKAEMALKVSEEKYRNIIEQTSDGVAILNSNGDFIDVNTGLCKLSGYTREELVGKNMKDTTAESDRENQKERYTRVLDGENMIWERQFKKKDGSFVTVEINEKVNTDGRVFAFYRDITERKRAELEHMRLQNLESLGLLAGGIAHDFNNLLSSVVGHVSMLLDESLEDEVRESLTLVERATRRAIGLTNQLLTFAKGGTPTKKILDLRKLITDTTKFSLSGSNVEGIFDFKETLKADADHGQISQVIQNLVINAKQAMPSGGTVKITVEDYDNFQNQRFIQISIKDSGTGIPNDIIDKIFDPYFTTKEKGNGLGLAVCHSIISRHEGRIYVDSMVGEGTTFTILLPAKKEEIQSEKKSEIVIEKKLNILIMDDESDIRELLSSMLIKQGHQVNMTKDGAECLSEYRKAREKGEPFDLIFMDLTVKGGFGGKEAIKQLRETDKDTKVIVSSGYAESSMSNYIEDGFNGILKKPYTKSELNKTIFNVLNS
jgi:two-component system, cell cycle sensor histidine kinase and response regulator CckA